MWPERCPKCQRSMTAAGFAVEGGFICTHCQGKLRKLKRHLKKKKSKGVTKSRGAVRVC